MEKPLCDKDCNHCPIILHPNSRMLTLVLNSLREEFGSDVTRIVNENCPNLTVCRDCHIDDFCHLDGCEISGD